MLQNGSHVEKSCPAADPSTLEEHDVPMKDNAENEDLNHLFNQLSNLECRSGDELMRTCDINFDSFFSEECIPKSGETETQKLEHSVTENSVDNLVPNNQHPCSSLSSSSKHSSSSIPSCRSKRRCRKTRVKKDVNPKSGADINAFKELFGIDCNSSRDRNRFLKYKCTQSFDVRSVSDMFSSSAGRLQNTCVSSSHGNDDAQSKSRGKKLPSQRPNSSTSDISSVSDSYANSSSGISLGSEDSGPVVGIPKETVQTSQVYIRSAYMDIIKTAIQRESQLKLKKPRVYDGLDLNSIATTRTKSRKKLQMAKPNS